MALEASLARPRAAPQGAAYEERHTCDLARAAKLEPIFDHVAEPIPQPGLDLQSGIIDGLEMGSGSRTQGATGWSNSKRRKRLGNVSGRFYMNRTNPNGVRTFDVLSEIVEEHDA